MLIFSTTFCGDLWVRVAGIPSLLNLTNKQPFFACLPLKTPFFSIYCVITNDTKYSVFFQKGRNVWYCDGSYQLVLCSDAMSQFRRCDKLSIEIASNHWDRKSHLCLRSRSGLWNEIPDYPWNAHCYCIVCSDLYISTSNSILC